MYGYTSVCLSVYPSVCLSVCPSICLSVNLCLSVCLFCFLPNVPVHPPIVTIYPPSVTAFWSCCRGQTCSWSSLSGLSVMMLSFLLDAVQYIVIHPPTRLSLPLLGVTVAVKPTKPRHGHLCPLSLRVVIVFI